MHYLTVATCVKDEPELDDFILIHQKLGVEHFVFYDRDGDNLTNKYRGRNDITVVKYPEPNTHHGSHLYTVQNFQGLSKWIAFIDADQVLFPCNTTDIKVALQEFELYAQIQVAWNTYGSNGLATKTDGSIYERFTRRATEEEGINNHSQSICQIDKIDARLPKDPHALWPKRGEISVDENHRKLGDNNDVYALVIPHTQKKLFVAHYILKSRQEYEIKRNKRRSDTWTMMDYLFDEQDRYSNVVEDLRIKEFWEKNCK